MGSISKVFIVTAGCCEQAEEGFHAGAIVFHAFDRHCINGGRSVISRIAENINVENHVVNGCRDTIGEDNIITHGEVIVNRAVFILDDFDITESVVGVIRAVLGTGFTLNAVLYNGAAAVSRKK